MIWSWLYFQTVDQNGFVEGRRQWVQKNWKFERTLLPESRQINTEGLDQGSGNEATKARVKSEK